MLPSELAQSSAESFLIDSVTCTGGNTRLDERKTECRHLSRQDGSPHSMNTDTVEVARNRGDQRHDIYIRLSS
jgi:hypothetical protein